jgi:hypothetical protein
MTRDPGFALSQELKAKQTLLDQLRALAADDPDFFTDLLEGETNLLELIAALDASILDDETLVDGAKGALDKLQARKGTAEIRIELKRRLPRPHPAADRYQDPAHAHRDAYPRGPSLKAMPSPRKTSRRAGGSRSRPGGCGRRDTRTPRTDRRPRHAHHRLAQRRPFDAVPLGQLADRIVAFLRERREDPQALITWRERNRHALRGFWARAPADALGVKQELEKMLGRQADEITHPRGRHGDSMTGTAQCEMPHIGIFWLVQTTEGEATLLAAGCPARFSERPEAFAA